MTDLFQAPHRTAFFQAVRLLHRLAFDTARDRPTSQRRPVGQDWGPAVEVVRFHAAPYLGFPSAEIASLRTSTEADATGLPRLDLVVDFMGLTGPMGVLPRHYTTLILQRARFKDFSLREWLDLFNHRIISLFYRAWEKYRVPFAFERYRLEGGGEPDAFTQLVYCLVGLGTRGLRGRMQVDDPAFLFFSGHFAHMPRSASALEGVLGDWLELPVEVLQAWPQWLRLEPEDRSALGDVFRGVGRNAQLGVDTVAGERIRDLQGKFRIRVGPVRYRDFAQLMPCGPGLRPLCQLARTYVGPEFDFDVQLVLLPEEVPWARLAEDGDGPPRLGWNTWARSREFTQLVDDAVFHLDDV